MSVSESENVKAVESFVIAFPFGRMVSSCTVSGQLISFRRYGAQAWTHYSRCHITMVAYTSPDASDFLQSIVGHRRSGLILHV